MKDLFRSLTSFPFSTTQHRLDHIRTHTLARSPIAIHSITYSSKQYSHFILTIDCFSLLPGISPRVASALLTFYSYDTIQDLKLSLIQITSLVTNLPFSMSNLVRTHFTSPTRTSPSLSQTLRTSPETEPYTQGLANIPRSTMSEPPEIKTPTPEELAASYVGKPPSPSPTPFKKFVKNLNLWNIQALKFKRLG